MPQRFLDVSNEALIRGWPRLRGWLDEDRAGLRLSVELPTQPRNGNALIGMTVICFEAQD